MNLLITGAWTDAKQHIMGIEHLGHKVYFMQWEQDELPCQPNMIEGVIANNLFHYHPVEAFIHLRYFQTTSAGLDRQPLAWLRDQKVIVNNARGVYSIPIAEYALTGILAFYKKQAVFSANQSKHVWEKQRNLAELYNKKVCIVGCGSVGTECAKRFQAFGCHVLGIDTEKRAKDFHEYQMRKDPFLSDRNPAGKFRLDYEPYQNITTLSSLDNILPAIDILVLTVPLTEDTRHLFDAFYIDKLKKKSILVNVSRGSVLDQDALIQALEDPERELRAVLDVFEEEPLSSDSPLWDMDNVIISPHNSFEGERNRERLSRLILKNLKNYL